MASLTRSTESYGPDPLLLGFWLTLAGLPLPLAVWIIVRDGVRPDLVVLLSLSVVTPAVVAAFALRFRVTFDADTFVYRRWGPTIRVRYSDVSEIEVANVTSITKQAVGAFIVTSRGERFPFWPKLFPEAAVTRFFQMDRSR